MKILKFFILGLIGTLGLIGNNANALSPEKDMQTNIAINNIEKHIETLERATDPKLIESLIQNIDMQIQQLKQFKYIKADTDDRRRNLIATWEILKNKIILEAKKKELKKSAAEELERAPKRVGKALEKLEIAAKEAAQRAAAPPIATVSQEELIEQFNKLMANVNPQNFDNWLIEAYNILAQLQNTMSRPSLERLKEKVYALHLDHLINYTPIQQLREKEAFKSWSHQLDVLRLLTEKNLEFKERVERNIEIKNKTGKKVIQLINELITNPPKNNYKQFLDEWAPATTTAIEYLRGLEFKKDATNATQDYYRINADVFLSDVYKDHINSLEPEESLKKVNEFAEKLIQNLRPFNLTDHINAILKKQQELIKLIQARRAQGN